MSSIVLDASVVGRIVLPGQDPGGAAAAALVRLLADGVEPVAPDLLAYEIGSLLRRYHGPEEARRAGLHRSLQIVRLAGPTPPLLERALRLVDEAGISFYDACYLALAEAESTTFWTEDREILAKFPGVARDTVALG